MSSNLEVRVVKFSDRKHYQLQWKDPLSGRKKTKSSGVPLNRKRDEAVKVASKLEAELLEARDVQLTTWDDFRFRYEGEHLTSLADGTAAKTSTVFDYVEKHLRPRLLRELTGSAISKLQAELRRKGLAEDTIRSLLAHLRAAMRWAEDLGLIRETPKFVMPKRAKGSKAMKGRAITTEEFERLLVATEKHVGQKRAASWSHYLRGLWWSGLRLTESLELHWTRQDKLRVDFSHEHPLLVVPGELEKGNKDRLLPIAPEFAEMLLAVPEEERNGFVFNPKAARVKGPRLQRQTVSAIVVEIGKLADIVVDHEVRTDKKKYASCHDLRRSFGCRWAARVMPPILQELMRHEDISTTMRYYVGQNATRTSEVLYAALESNKIGNTPDFATGQKVG